MIFMNLIESETATKIWCNIFDRVVLTYFYYFILNHSINYSYFDRKDTEPGNEKNEENDIFSRLD